MGADIGILKAWVTHNYKARLEEIDFLRSAGGTMGFTALHTFEYREGRIFMDEKYMNATFNTKIKDAGYLTPRFFAFADGFKGGRIPHRWHFILRRCYKAGVEAKATAA